MSKAGMTDSGASYKCDCGHLMGLPTTGSAVVGLACGNCNTYWNISYSPNRLLGVVSEWRCPECNTNNARCRDTFWNKDKCKIKSKSQVAGTVKER